MSTTPANDRPNSEGKQDKRSTSGSSAHITGTTAASSREASVDAQAAAAVPGKPAAALRATASSLHPEWREAAPSSSTAAAAQLSPPQHLHPLAAGFYGAGKGVGFGAGNPRSPFKLACPGAGTVQQQHSHSLTAVAMASQPPTETLVPSSSANSPSSLAGPASAATSGESATASTAIPAINAPAALLNATPIAGQPLSPANASAPQTILSAQSTASTSNSQSSAQPTSWRSLLEQRRGPAPSAAPINPASRFRAPGFPSNSVTSASNASQSGLQPGASTPSLSTAAASKPASPSNVPATASAATANAVVARPPSYSTYGAGFGPRRPFDGWGRSAGSAYGISSHAQQQPSTTAAVGSAGQDANARPPNAVGVDSNPANQPSMQQVGSPRLGTGSPQQQQRSPAAVGGSSANITRPVSSNAINTTGRDPITGATLVTEKDRISGAASPKAAGSLYGASYSDRFAQQQRDHDRMTQSAADRDRVRVSAGDSRSPPIASRTGISSLFGSHGTSTPVTSAPANAKASSASPTVQSATAPTPASASQSAQHKRPHSLSQSSADKDRPAMAFGGWSNSPGSINARGREVLPASGANESRTASASQSPFGASAASNQNPPASAPGTGHFRGASMPGNITPGPATSTGAYATGSSAQNTAPPKVGTAGPAVVRTSYLYHGGQRAPAAPPSLPPVGTGAASAAAAAATTVATPGSATVSRTAGTGLGLNTPGTLAGTAAAIEKDRERENQAASLANNWRQHQHPQPMSAHSRASVPPTPANSLHIPPYGASAAVRKQEQSSPQLQQRPGESAPPPMHAMDREPVSSSWRDATVGHKRKRSDAPQTSAIASAVALEHTSQPHQQTAGAVAATLAQPVTSSATIAAPHPEQTPAEAQMPLPKRRSGPLFGPEDVKGAALRPPLMAVRSDLVVRALHKISHQQTVASGTMHTPPFLGRFVYDPFIDPAVLLDADLMKRGVGGKAEIWLDTNWLQGEIWEAGAPAHPAASRATSPTPDKPDGAVVDLADDAYMDAEESVESERPRNTVDPAWTLWDLPSLRSRKIWGTDVYTDDSDILAACIHSGWLRLGSTAPLFSVGKSDTEPPVPAAQPTKKARKLRKITLPKQRSLKITIVVAPRLIKYEGSLRAGVRSRSWGNSHDGVSFAIESVELVEDATHRFGRSRLKNLNTDFGILAKERCACYSGCEHRYMHPPLQLGRLLVKIT